VSARITRAHRFEGWNAHFLDSSDMYIAGISESQQYLAFAQAWKELQLCFNVDELPDDTDTTVFAFGLPSIESTVGDGGRLVLLEGSSIVDQKIPGSHDDEKLRNYLVNVVKGLPNAKEVTREVCLLLSPTYEKSSLAYQPNRQVRPNHWQAYTRTAGRYLPADAPALTDALAGSLPRQRRTASLSRPLTKHPKSGSPTPSASASLSPTEDDGMDTPTADVISRLIPDDVGPRLRDRIELLCSIPGTPLCMET
jgi:hypothetical protein